MIPRERTAARDAGRPKTLPGGRTVIRGASEVLTCAAAAPDGIGRIPHGEVLIEDGRILAAGQLGEARAEHVLDAEGCVVMPGFVDCHTHAVFGGDRVEEYVAGCAGRSPAPGAPRGIAGTVAATRGLGVEQLVAAALPRIEEMRAHGTTTVEIKSGYGLDARTELEMLEANRALEARTGVGVVSTYLGAHALPHDRQPAEYVDAICDLIPHIATTGSARFCDVYCEEGYFTLAQTTRILEAGRENGLAPKIHLDAYSHTGAAGIATALGATSVDHLNHTRPDEIEALAAANVVGVVMPLLEFAVQHARPARPAELLARGLRVALATDCCPGCMASSMQLVVQHACRTGAMTVAQAIRSATIDAAAAAGCDERVGSLEPGKRADLLILDIARHEDLAYRLGHNAVRVVMIAGAPSHRGPTVTRVAA